MVPKWPAVKFVCKFEKKVCLKYFRGKIKPPIQESYYTKVTPKFNQINVLIHSNTRVTVFKSSFFPLFDAFMNTK